MPEDQRRGRREEGGRGGVPHTPGVDQPPGEEGESDGGREEWREGWREGGMEGGRDGGREG